MPSIRKKKNNPRPVKMPGVHQTMGNIARLQPGQDSETHVSPVVAESVECRLSGQSTIRVEGPASNRLLGRRMGTEELMTNDSIVPAAAEIANGLSAYQSIRTLECIISVDEGLHKEEIAGEITSSSAPDLKIDVLSKASISDYVDDILSSADLAMNITDRYPKGVGNWQRMDELARAEMQKIDGELLVETRMILMYDVCMKLTRQLRIQLDAYLLDACRFLDGLLDGSLFISLP